MDLYNPPSFWLKPDFISMARSLRLAVVQQQYDTGRLDPVEAFGLLRGCLTPGDEATRYDDSRLLDQHRPTFEIV